MIGIKKNKMNLRWGGSSLWCFGSRLRPGFLFIVGNGFVIEREQASGGAKTWREAGRKGKALRWAGNDKFFREPTEVQKMFFALYRLESWRREWKRNATYLRPTSNGEILELARELDFLVYIPNEGVEQAAKDGEMGEFGNRGHALSTKSDESLSKNERKVEGRRSKGALTTTGRASMMREATSGADHSAWNLSSSKLSKEHKRRMSSRAAVDLRKRQSPCGVTARSGAVRGTGALGAGEPA